MILGILPSRWWRKNNSVAPRPVGHLCPQAVTNSLGRGSSSSLWLGPVCNLMWADGAWSTNMCFPSCPLNLNFIELVHLYPFFFLSPKLNKDSLRKKKQRIWTSARGLDSDFEDMGESGEHNRTSDWFSNLEAEGTFDQYQEWGAEKWATSLDSIPFVTSFQAKHRMIAGKL